MHGTRCQLPKKRYENIYEVHVISSHAVLFFVATIWSRISGWSHNSTLVETVKFIL